MSCHEASFSQGPPFLKDHMILKRVCGPDTFFGPVRGHGIWPQLMVHVVIEMGTIAQQQGPDKNSFFLAWAAWQRALFNPVARGLFKIRRRFLFPGGPGEFCRKIRGYIPEPSYKSCKASPAINLAEDIPGLEPRCSKIHSRILQPVVGLLILTV